MKKIYAFFMVIILVMSLPIVAQEEPTTDLPDPGTTPDDFLYFMDTALDNLALALTFAEPVSTYSYDDEDEHYEEVGTMGY